MAERSFISFRKNNVSTFLNLNQICQVFVNTESAETSCTVKLSNSDTFMLDGEVMVLLLSRLTELDISPHVDHK